MSDAQRPAVPTRAEVFAWVFYDWANSAYSTLLITAVLYYVQKVLLPGRLGPAAFAWCIGLSMFAAAMLSPIVGAMADANRSKRRWLAVTAWGGSAAAIALALAPTSMPAVALSAFVAMCVLFDLSLVPYNGFLQEISDDRTVNRISAWGFALGYLGGSIPLAMLGAVVYFGPHWGLTDVGLQCRAGILMLGLWWGLFSTPTILLLRDRGGPPVARQSWRRAARNALRENAQTLRNVRRYPTVALFLLAYLFYSEGMQTVITQANTLAERDFHFSLFDLVLFILAIQLVALPGSLVMGWLADRWGQKPTMLASLAVWSALIVAAVVIQTVVGFWIMGLTLALVLGGPQAVSRAIMANLSPREHAAEFFGFYNVSGKAASFLGPVLFGAVIFFTESARAAAGSLLVFFIVGVILLWRVDLPRAATANPKP